MKSLEVIRDFSFLFHRTKKLVHLGYLYFHAAPDSVSFHQECTRRVKNLHTSDCLRANKSFLFFPC
jgi:hypothetical protein